MPTDAHTVTRTRTHKHVPYATALHIAVAALQCYTTSATQPVSDA